MHRRAKSAIRDLVLDLRETLEGEIERELRRYGIYPERDWLPADELGHLTQEERNEHRPRIEAAIARERDAGLDQAKAVEAYVREAAYTHMNRLLGLKCMETRELIEETITTRRIYSERSKRHRDYLDDHPAARRTPDRGLIPMLQEAYAEVSQHIGVVFDPESEYTVVWPRHQVLKDCIDDINALSETVARKLDQDLDAMPSVYGDDTFLGWVYQYFQEKEKDRVFRELRTKKKKIGGYDIVPATTIYTEHYMVQFLVENSLGALWMEMYPASDLCEGWDYFVEDPNLQNDDGTRQRGREPRPVAELSLLDPACGSGHFLLYAFDLFAQMYEAEARMAGRPVDRPAIARRILRQNLHGIDIDLRSIQLSALNLYMKACTYAGLRLNQLQNGEPVQMNLACADIVLREGPELEELLGRFENDPLTQELIKTIWQGLQNARELGSLLKVEEQIDEVIARKREAEKGTFWEHPEDLWQQWKQDFLHTLRSYVDRATETFDVNRRMFGQEAIKGVELLDLLSQRYEVVTTNPPYLSSRKIEREFKQTLKAYFPKAGADLYSAFVDKCVSLLTVNGFAALITMHSFLFLSSFRFLRQRLLRRDWFRTLAHLGTGAFSDISGERVSTAMYVINASAPARRQGKYLRLVDEENKASALRAVAGAEESDASGLAFRNDQANFLAITGAPVVYWVGAELLQLFDRHSTLRRFATVRQGIGTDRYTSQRLILYHWELRREWLGDRFKHFGKCDDNRWYGTRPEFINWTEDAVAYLETHGNKLPSRHLYFREGIICNPLGSSGFRAQYLPANSVFGKGPAVFAESRTQLLCILGYLNTNLAEILLGILNPTINFLTSDVKNLPFKAVDRATTDKMTSWVEESIALQKQILAFDLQAVSFKQSGIEWIMSRAVEKPPCSLREACQRYLGYRQGVFSRLSFLKKELENEFSAMFGLSNEASAEISQTTGIARVGDGSDEPGLINADDLQHEVENFLTHRIWELCKQDEDGVIPYAEGLRNPPLLDQVRGEIEAVFGAENAISIEAEMDEILGRGGLAGWLENPFFNKHRSQFKRRPILWHITSPDEHFRVLVYYHKLDRDTLPKVRSQYLWPQLERARARLRAAKLEKPPDVKTIGELEEIIVDLEECDERLQRVIQGDVDVDLPDWAVGPYRGGTAPYDPDLDDGVKVNILPLQAAELLPYKNVV